MDGLIPKYKKMVGSWVPHLWSIARIARWTDRYCLKSGYQGQGPRLLVVAIAHPLNFSFQTSFEPEAFQGWSFNFCCNRTRRSDALLLLLLDNCKWAPRMAKPLLYSTPNAIPADRHGCSGKRWRFWSFASSPAFVLKSFKRKTLSAFPLLGFNPHRRYNNTVYYIYTYIINLSWWLLIRDSTIIWGATYTQTYIQNIQIYNIHITCNYVAGWLKSISATRVLEDTRNPAWHQEGSAMGNQRFSGVFDRGKEYWDVLRNYSPHLVKVQIAGGFVLAFRRKRKTFNTQLINNQ